MRYLQGPCPGFGAAVVFIAVFLCKPFSQLDPKCFADGRGPFAGERATPFFHTLGYLKSVGWPNAGILGNVVGMCKEARGRTRLATDGSDGIASVEFVVAKL